MIGYAQAAYQNGGGNISPLPELRRSSSRQRLPSHLRPRTRPHAASERRNDLFCLPTTAATTTRSGGLDGDIAYNINAQAGARAAARPAHVVLSNPVAAVGGARSRQSLENRRTENGSTLVDVVLKQGDVLTQPVRSNLPEFVRSAADQSWREWSTLRGSSATNALRASAPMGYTTLSTETGSRK